MEYFDYETDEAYKIKDLIFKIRTAIHQIDKIVGGCTHEELFAIGSDMNDINDSLARYEVTLLDFIDKQFAAMNKAKIGGR